MTTRCNVTRESASALGKGGEVEDDRGLSGWRRSSGGESSRLGCRRRYERSHRDRRDGTSRLRKCGDEDERFRWEGRTYHRLGLHSLAFRTRLRKRTLLHDDGRGRLTR